MAYRTYAPTNGFIVAQDGTGDFKTITAAMAAAASVPGVTVFVRDGTYTENFTLPVDTILSSYDSLNYRASGTIPSVTIAGKVTATYSGTSSISGIRLQTNGDFCLSVTGTNPTVLNLSDVYIDCTNNTGISFTSTNASAYLSIFFSTGNVSSALAAYFSCTSTGTLRFQYFTGENTAGSSVQNTFSNGSFFYYWSHIDQGFTLTSINQALAQNSTINGQTAGNSIALTTVTSGSSRWENCVFGSGSASAISVGAGTTVALDNPIIQTIATNAITGAGTVTGCNFTFTSSSLINTTTQTLQPAITGTRQTNFPADGLTLVNTDDFVGVNTTAPRTVTLPASPSIGQNHTIADITGTANLNNITVNGNGHNILSNSSAATYIITNPGQSTSFLYTGTVWKAISAFDDSTFGGIHPNHSVLLGTGTNSISSVGPSATAGQILRSGGASADPVYSTATYPATAGTSGKILISDGTNIISSTPTFPNASATSGKFIQSDGTNWIASTPTLPTSAGTSGKVLQSNGTNYVESTPTYPSASGTAGKILRSDGTNNLYTTATFPDTAGTSGNVLTSDGTNWSSTAPAGVSLTVTSNSASSVSLSTTVAKTITSITLSAGNYLISSLCLVSGTVADMNFFASSISTTNNTLTGTLGDTQTEEQGTTRQILTSSIPFVYVTPGISTTYYLVAQANATTATLTGYGRITAVKIG